MHVVVIGAGSIGQRHLKNLDKLGVEHLSIVDPQFEKRREAKDAVKRAITVAALSGDLGLKHKVDACIVAVPTYLHIPLALEAMDQFQAPLLIEKPISHTIAGLDRLAV